MKKQKIILTSILFLCAVLSMTIIRNNTNIKKETKLIKQMSENEQLTSLETEINNLNASHTEYANSIQTAKQKLATAITNAGVSTSENDKFETMATNIGNILQARTSDATATAEDIAEGKTAWVNGQKVIRNLEKTYIMKQVMCESNSSQGGGGVSSFYIDVKKGEKINFGDISIVKSYGNNVTGSWTVYATLNDNIVYGTSTESNTISFETETTVRKGTQIIVEEGGVLMIKLQTYRYSATGGTLVKVNGISIEK